MHGALHPLKADAGLQTDDHSQLTRRRIDPHVSGRADRLRARYGGPPKLHAKAEARPYSQRNATVGSIRVGLLSPPS